MSDQNRNSWIKSPWAWAGGELALGTVAIIGVRSAANGALEALVPWFKEKEFDDTLFNLAGALAWLALVISVISHARDSRSS